VPGKQTLGKEFKEKFFAECSAEGHSANNFSKKNFFSLPSVRMVSNRQRIFQKKNYLPSAM
jgi:hypothetical protein